MWWHKNDDKEKNKRIAPNISRNVYAGLHNQDAYGNSANTGSTAQKSKRSSDSGSSRKLLIFFVVFLGIALLAGIGIAIFDESNSWIEGLSEEVEAFFSDGGDNAYEDYTEEYDQYAEGTIDVEGMYTLIYLGTEISMGDKLDSFAKAMDSDAFDEDMDYVIEAEEGYYTTLHSVLESYLDIGVYNDSDSECEVKDCTVDCIYFYPAIEYDNPFTAEYYYMGISLMNCTPEDFVDALGDDYDHSSDTYGEEYYRWYTEDGTITVCFSDDGITLKSLQIYTDSYFYW